MPPGVAESKGIWDCQSIVPFAPSASNFSSLDRREH
jgi:hypothetical protein